MSYIYFSVGTEKYLKFLEICQLSKSYSIDVRNID